MTAAKRRPRSRCFWRPRRLCLPIPALHTQVGGMMLEAGQPQQALEQFEKALNWTRMTTRLSSARAWPSFALGDDRDAVRYLGEASRENTQRSGTGEATEKPRAKPRRRSHAGSGRSRRRCWRSILTARARDLERARRAGTSFERLTLASRSAPRHSAFVAQARARRPRVPQPDRDSRRFTPRGQAAELGGGRPAGASTKYDPGHGNVFDMEVDVTARCRAARSPDRCGSSTIGSTLAPLMSGLPAMSERR